MTKAQSFFGGTSRNKQPDPTLNQVGHNSAGTFNTSQQRRDANAGGYSLRPPVTRQSNGGKGSNHQMVRDGNTKAAGRPNLPGKVDNRHVGH